jgi:HK97 gp10 family phage protein
MSTTGFTEAARAFRKLGDNIIKKDLARQALLSAAPTVKKALDAALNPHKRSGGDYVIVYEAKAEQDTATRILVGPPKDKYYLYFLEFGTSRQAPRGVLRAAAAAVEAEAQKQAMAELGRLVQAEINRMSLR